MKFFALTIFFCLSISSFAQQAFSKSSDSLDFTKQNFKPIKLTKHLQYIGLSEPTDFYYFPIRERVSNYRFRVTATDVAHYLYVERPLLQQMNPNSNYVGSQLFDPNYIYTLSYCDFEY